LPTGVRSFVGGAALALGALLSSSNPARALAPSTRPSRTAAAGDGGAGASRGRPPRPFSWGASILRSQAHGRYGMSWSTRLVKLVAVLALLGSALAQPPDSLRIMAPAAPGGGWDGTARAMQTALQQAGLVENVEVFNVPGAGGTIGLSQLATAE